MLSTEVVNMGLAFYSDEQKFIVYLDDVAVERFENLGEALKYIQECTEETLILWKEAKHG